MKPSRQHRRLCRCTLPLNADGICPAQVPCPPVATVSNLRQAAAIRRTAEAKRIEAQRFTPSRRRIKST